VRRKIGKGWILIFLVVWMVNCASEELGSGDKVPQKEKPADEVDLAPRPTRSKK
jgi:hypothetical protein